MNEESLAPCAFTLIVFGGGAFAVAGLSVLLGKLVNRIIDREEES